MVGSFGETALALVPEKQASRQIAVLPIRKPQRRRCREQQQQFQKSPNASAPALPSMRILRNIPSGLLSDLARAQRDKLASGADSPAGPKRIAVLPAPGSADRQQAPAANVVSLPPAADPSARSRTRSHANCRPNLRRVGCDPGSVNGVWSPEFPSGARAVQPPRRHEARHPGCQPRCARCGERPARAHLSAGLWQRPARRRRTLRRYSGAAESSSRRKAGRARAGAAPRERVRRAEPVREAPPRRQRRRWSSARLRCVPVRRSRSALAASVLASAGSASAFWDAVDERLPVSRRDRVAVSCAGTGTGWNDSTARSAARATSRTTPPAPKAARCCRLPAACWWRSACPSSRRHGFCWSRCRACCSASLR